MVLTLVTVKRSLRRQIENTPISASTPALLVQIARRALANTLPGAVQDAFS